MEAPQRRVLEFHEAFDLPRPLMPGFDEFTSWVGTALLEEELEELKTAVKNEDMVEVIDALADIEYVLYGAAIALGVDLEDFSKEVHRSNMTKIWPDGKPRYRDDGKVRKPEGYSRANIFGLLQELIARRG